MFPCPEFRRLARISVIFALLFVLVTQQTDFPTADDRQPLEVCNYKPLEVCYFLYLTKNTTWWDAKNTCRRRGGSLFCYNNDDEVNYLLDLIDDFYHKDSLTIWLLENGECPPKQEKRRRENQKCYSLYLSDLGSSYQPRFLNLMDCNNKAIFICKLDHIPDGKAKQYCPKVEVRGIQWPETESGAIAHAPCPAGKMGKAKWRCLEGKWFPEYPDLSGCVSEIIESIYSKLTASNFESSLLELENITRRDSKTNLMGGDIKKVIEVLDKTKNIFINDIPSEKKSSGKAKQVAQNMLGCGDNLLQWKEAWFDFSRTKKSTILTNFFETVEKIGQLLRLPTSEVYTEGKVSLVFQTTIRDGNTMFGDQSITFPLKDKNKLSRWSENLRENGTITFPSGVNLTGETTDQIQAVFTVYNDLRDILSDHEQFWDGDDKWRNLTLNSVVIGTTFLGDDVNTESEETQPSKISQNQKVEITVKHLVKLQNPRNATCVFWDVDEKQWDSEGCRLVASNNTHSVCFCDHLTNFAVLMDVEGRLQDIPEVHKFLLTGITIVGCCISIISLALTILVYTSYRVLRNLKGTIHCNLCIALLLAEILLLAGLERTENKISCAVIAGLLHYLFLTAFSWMFLEAAHVYILCIKVFNLGRSYKEVYYGTGYGIPLLIVGISAGISHENYGTDKYCWLSNDKGLIWSFVGPVILILLLNISVLVIALRKTEQLAKNLENNTMQRMKNWMRNTMILSPTLGLTWCLGFIYFTKATLVWAYIFTIFNSLQGFFIFLLYCCLEDKTRKLIVSTIRKRSSIVSISTASTKLRRQSTENTTKSSSNQSAPSSPVPQASSSQELQITSKKL